MMKPLVVLLGLFVVGCAGSGKTPDDAGTGYVPGEVEGSGGDGDGGDGDGGDGDRNPPPPGDGDGSNGDGDGSAGDDAGTAKSPCVGGQTCDCNSAACPPCPDGDCTFYCFTSTCTAACPSGDCTFNCAASAHCTLDCGNETMDCVLCTDPSGCPLVCGGDPPAAVGCFGS